MIGIPRPATAAMRVGAPVVEGALKAGLLVNRTAERVVRLLPPLNVTKSEIEEAASILDGVLSAVRAEVTT